MPAVVAGQFGIPPAVPGILGLPGVAANEGAMELIQMGENPFVDAPEFRVAYTPEAVPMIPDVGAILDLGAAFLECLKQATKPNVAVLTKDRRRQLEGGGERVVNRVASGSAHSLSVDAGLGWGWVGLGWAGLGIQEFSVGAFPPYVKLTPEVEAQA